MAEIYGIVKRITAKQRGKGTAYSVQMDNGEWYGHGFQRPNFNEGAEIGFDIAWNGQYANIDQNSVEVLNAGQGPQNMGGGQQRQRQGGSQQGGQRGGQQNRSQAQGRPQAAGSGGMSKDDYWRRREERDIVVQKQIQYQAARNSAIEVIKVGVQAGAVKLPAAKDKALDALLALVDEVTIQYDAAVSDVANPQPKANTQQRMAPPEEQSGGEEFDDDIPFN